MGKTGRGPTIRQRKRVLIACEGQSERGYAALLRLLSDSLATEKVAVDTPILDGRGFAAQARDTERGWNEAKKREVPFSSGFLLTDRDAFGESMQDEPALARLRRLGIRVIFQSPDHEGFLLAHFEPVDTELLTSQNEARRRPLKHWPDYEKGCTAAVLRPRLPIERIRSAAERIEELKSLLGALGL